MIKIDRREFIASLGGAAVVGLMSHEARADALEHYLEERLYASAEGMNGGGSAPAFPTVAELDAQISTRSYRRGVGTLMLNSRGDKVERLAALPARPTVVDFFEHRFQRTRNHCFQSANKARERGARDEVVLACLLHDVVQELIRVDHGWWGAQMFEPYVPELTSWAIRYHQALRFYPDEEAGYFYPDLYHRLFGEDYVPPPHIVAARDTALAHPWYFAAREVTVSDLYAFDENAVVSIDPFMDLIERHFRHPAEGLGNDNSPVAHMWRSIANPDAPL
jgi:hypothetical protein